MMEPVQIRSSVGGVLEDTPERGDELGRVLLQMVRHPVRTLGPCWSWKAATMSAAFRAATFFATNLRAGRHKAIQAMVVEMGFAIFAAGLLGAASQRLRHATPLWATGMVVWLLMPLTMVVAQFGVHKAAGTEYLGTGLVVSFVFAAIASSFSWYAMRHGALLSGEASTSLEHDARHLPRIILSYILAMPRTLWKLMRWD
jgi:hypothetical protein